MPTTNPLGTMLNTLFERRSFFRRVRDNRTLPEICGAVLAEKAEASTSQLADAALLSYKELDDAGKVAFFEYLNADLDIDVERVAELARAYAADKSPEAFVALMSASEPRRQELFRRLNQAPGATGDLVRMRADLLRFRKDAPDLARTDRDLVHLLRSWFNRGFLVLRQITWDSPASILEKIIAYEAVHEIQTWDDLRLRLYPSDRRLFAFFHPAMPGEPLIFVEVALSKGIPSSIHDVLSDDRDILDENQADTAVFYSISNCQKGLAGISFGNSLIKQVARDLSRELPNIKTFVTLSPIPGLAAWLDREGLSDAAQDAETLKKLAAHYLIAEKDARGRPLDPVARFHLGNGALIHAVHVNADLSENGMAQSRGAMVNYLYDLNRIAANLEAFEQRGEIAASASLRSLAKQAVKTVSV